MKTNVMIPEEIEGQIYSYLDLDNPQCFFLFAGAGSGKTRTLVEVLKKFKENNARRLIENNQKVAVITYTNAATDEIKRRLNFDTTFVVSTIHSFLWELINSYQINIKSWVRQNTLEEIAELNEKQARGRVGKASEERAMQIVAKEKRLANLDSIKRFTYNPNGVNSGKDSLNHAEVIKIASDFLFEKPSMQKILIQKFPIILIDESQDTKRELVDALFRIEELHPGKFVLGLFGDTMQRIYQDGKENLGQNLPDNWKKPAKEFNYRCPRRVIELINNIRSDVDEQKQKPSVNNPEGTIRLFIVNSYEGMNKASIEQIVSQSMTELTGDEDWIDVVNKVKVLTLEHHMAASRGGFLNFFEPLYKSVKDTTGLLDGTLKGIPFLLSQVLPLVTAIQQENEFEIAQLLKRYSPLLDKTKFAESESQMNLIRQAKSAIDDVKRFFNENKTPTILEFLKVIVTHSVFIVPDEIRIACALDDIADDVSGVEDEEDYRNVGLSWYAALSSSISELKAYSEYIEDKSAFGTHQGVKGLEFPRVMAILDDEDSRGFLFKYDKLLGVAPLTLTDKKNEADGIDTSVNRARRLFYVICSRAQKSLAVVAYTSNPAQVKEYAVSKNWFKDEEIIMC